MADRCGASWVSPLSLRDRGRGALAGAVIGDALGARFEGHQGTVPVDAVERHLSSAGSWRGTDDTQMTLALADSMVHAGGVDPSDLFGRLHQAWKDDPDRGYGRGAAHLFIRASAGEDPAEVAARMFGGEGSFGNGAAMRVAPCAVFARGDLELAADLAAQSSKVTHTHVIAEQSAVAQAVAVAFALSGEPLDRRRLVSAVKARLQWTVICSRLERVAALTDGSSPSRIADTTGTGLPGHEAVCAAIAVACDSTTYTDAVRLALLLGGDTDTIASMAGAILGAHTGLSGIPARWIAGVDEVGMAVRLADRLLEASPTS